MNDTEELVRLVMESEDFKDADSVVEVRTVVKRLLRIRLIDLHLGDSEDVVERERIVKAHIELITLRSIMMSDGIVIIPDNYDELVALCPDTGCLRPMRMQ